MTFIGDIERLVAQLWPFRLPIAIGLLFAIVAFGYVAWRRGWYRVVIAHPRTSVIIVALVIVIGGPMAWILGSPLFIRPEAIIEDAPVAAAGATTTTLLEGEFEGADDFHFGRGRAALIEVAPETYVLRLEDFSVLNGPDLFVYLSPDPDGWTEDAINLGALRSTDGTFSYDVPEGVDPGEIGSAIIWCRAFSVLFATAALSSPNA